MQSTIYSFQHENADIGQRINTLRSVMPSMPSPNNHIVTRDTKEKLPPTFNPTDYVKASFTSNARPNRAIGLPFGLFGTFMGIYNQAQI